MHGENNMLSRLNREGRNDFHMQIGGMIVRIPCETCKYGDDCTRMCEKWRYWLSCEWNRVRRPFMTLQRPKKNVWQYHYLPKKKVDQDED